MYIKELIIYGYGKWENKRISLTDGFVAFLGENEMGKSTLHAFILSMLFGLPKGNRKKDYNTYVPKTSAQYGGKLVLANTPYGEVTIERVRKGKSSFEQTIITQHNDVLTQDDLDMMLGGMDATLYNRFFAITLNQLQMIETISKEELNRYFLTVGLSGSDTLFHWHDEWLLQSDKLYRPTATKLPLNTVLENYKQQYDLVEQLANKQKGYGLLVKQVGQIEQELVQLEQQENHYIQKQQETAILEQLYPLYERFLALNMPLETENVPKDLKQIYDKITLEKESVMEQLVKYQERVNVLDIPEPLQWFKAHAAEIKRGVMLLPKVEQILKQIGILDYERDVQEELLQKELKRLHITENVVPDEPIVLSESIKTVLNSIQQTQQQISLLDKTHQKQLQELAHSRDKEVLLTQNYQFAERMNRKKSVESHSSVVLPISSAFIGGIGTVASVLLQHYWVGGAFLLLTVFSMIGLIFKKIRLKKQEQYHQEQELSRQMLYEDNLSKQQGVSQQWADELSQTKQQQVLQQQLLETLQAQVRTYQNEMKLPLEISLEAIYLGELDNIIDSKQSLREKALQRENYLKQLSQFDEGFAFFNERLQKTSDDMLIYRRERVIQFKQFVDKWQVEEYRLQEQQKYNYTQYKDIAHLQERLEVLQAKERDLFEQLQVNSVVEFENKLTLQAKEATILEERELLYAQIAPYQERLETYVKQPELRNEHFITLQQQKQTLLTQRATLQQEIRFLEEDGRYNDEKQKLETLHEMALEHIKQVAVYQMSAKLISYVLQQDKQETVDTIIQRANHYFSRLTDNRYTQLHFSEDTLFVKREDGVFFELFELSMGTLNQLYIALRLAFIMSIQDRLTLPLLIDDCFVNFDAKRKATMLSILQEITTHHQIIYFTYDATIQSTSAHVIALETI